MPANYGINSNGILSVHNTGAFYQQQCEEVIAEVKAAKDVKISHVSDVITSEIIEVCNVNDESQQLKKVQ